jgi:hypothetical protein
MPSHPFRTRVAAATASLQHRMLLFGMSAGPFWSAHDHEHWNQRRASCDTRAALLGFCWKSVSIR